MWNRPNITTTPRRRGSRHRRRRAGSPGATRRGVTARAPFDTPVEPLVRNTLLASSLVPTRVGVVVERRVEPSGRGHDHVESPSGSATARATSSNSGWATTSRGCSISSAAAASGSVKLGLIGARAAPSFDGAVADLERVERGRSPPGDAVADGRRPRRRAGARHPVRAGVELAEGADVVAEGRADARRATPRQARQDVVDPDVQRQSDLPTARERSSPMGTSGSSGRAGTAHPGRSGRPTRSGTW